MVAVCGATTPAGPHDDVSHSEERCSGHVSFDRTAMGSVETSQQKNGAMIPAATTRVTIDANTRM